MTGNGGPMATNYSNTSNIPQAPVAESPPLQNNYQPNSNFNNAPATNNFANTMNSVPVGEAPAKTPSLQSNAFKMQRNKSEFSLKTCEFWY